MSYGYGYDSVEGRALCGAITSIMTGEAYAESARMAAAMGPFPGYRDARASGVPKPVAKDNVAPMLDVIEQHRCAVREIPDNEEFGYLKEEAAKGGTTKAGAVFNEGDVLGPKIAGVKLMAEPSDSAKVLATLGRGDEVVVTGGDKDGFIQVQGNGGTGWIKIVLVTKR
jgi:ribonucleotide reductase alpha subunit